jgi:hypothetical protein
MSFSSEDRMKDAVMPMVRALMPAREIRRQRAMRRAISDDGYVKARALLPLTTTGEDGVSASHTDTNSSITDPKSYLSGTLVLSDGIWRLKFKAGITGRLNTTSNLNATLLVNLTESNNFQIPLASGDMASVWPRLTIENVPGGGEIPWALQFRPSAGVATVEAGFVDWRVERLA